jgi:hypothetical protein
VTALFPEDSAERKTFPIYSGLLQYFPSALAAVANHSYKGNEKHNPGQPLHHDRAKSGDEPDALVRHLMEGDLVGMAWRALAMLQKKLEADGAPVAPGARNVPPKEHRRVATPAEMDAYRQNGARCDTAGLVVSVGDVVRIVATTPGDVQRGWNIGDHGRVASLEDGLVLVQIGTSTRWFIPSKLEWVRP